MVAVAVASPVGTDRVHVPVEVRGNIARLWDGVSGEVVLSGPAGTSKTRGILEWIHLRCCRERLRVLILRKTLESLKASAMVTFIEQVLYRFDGKRSPNDGVSYFGGNKILPAQFTYDETGSVIVLGGMDNPSKVLSTEYDIVYVNECTELTLDEWEKITGRTDRPKLGAAPEPSVVIGDCNPDSPNHWIKQRADDGLVQLWPTTHRDNPAMWETDPGRWTESGRRYLSGRLMKLTGVRRERFLYGKWVAAEGQVYDAWDDAVHVVRRKDVAHRLIGARHVGSADWGWSNPGCSQIWAIDRDGRLYLVAEHYHTRQPFEAWWVPRFAAMDARYEVDAWYCDPSEPQNIARLKAAGLNAVPAVNDLLPGIGAVQDRLIPAGDGIPRLFVLEDALIERDESLAEQSLPTSFAQELGRYVWAKNVGGETLKDRPVDAMNHGADSARYAVASIDLGGEPGPFDPAVLDYWQQAPR